MSQDVDLEKLETFIGRWAPQLVAFIADLRSLGVKVDLSLGVPTVSPLGKKTIAVTLKISVREG